VRRLNPCARTDPRPTSPARTLTTCVHSLRSDSSLPASRRAAPRRSDLHRYNLKRKVAGLKPLTREAFEAKAAASASAAGAAEGDKRAGGRRRTGTGDAEADGDDPMGAPAEGRVNPKSKAAWYARAANLTDEELIDARIASAPAFGPGHDLFSSHVSADLSENLRHMAKRHGFAIPYADYVCDLPGLVRYLQEKVYIGCFALQDGKQFHSVEAVQAHMRDKGACRFDLEGHEEEFADFYDLEALAAESPLWVEAEVGEEDGEEAEVAIVYRPPVAQAEASGEGSSLVVGGGHREVGHRSLRRYYKQSYKGPQPEEETMRKLLLQYREMGLVKPAGAVGARIGARGVAARGEKGRRAGDEARRDLKLGMRRNMLIKGNTTSQNIIFG